MIDGFYTSFEAADIAEVSRQRARQFAKWADLPKNYKTGYYLWTDADIREMISRRGVGGGNMHRTAKKPLPK
jgi:hypothetical protein